MKFTRVQNKESRAIIKHLINDKEVTKNEYEEKGMSRVMKGWQYTNSVTTSDNVNYYHTHNIS